MLKKQIKDQLVEREVKIYSFISYLATAIVLISIFLTAQAKTDAAGVSWAVIGLGFLAIGAVFGFAVKHDTRVLDLREKKPNG